MKRLSVLVLAAALGTSCNDPITTTTPSTGSTVIFTSQLAVGGFTWRSITVNTAGEVKVFLSSLIPDTTARVGVGLGTFDGATCTLTTTTQAPAGGTDAVITTTLGTGNFCIRIWDLGNLTKPNDFSISVSLP